MKTNYLFIVPLALILLACSPPRLYQTDIKSNWPQKGLLNSFVGNGVVYLKNGSNVTGQILICPFTNGDHEPGSTEMYLRFLPTGDIKTQDIQYIYYNDVARVKILNAGNNDSTEFRTFGGTIANLLGTKNRVKLYYRLWESSTSVDVNNSLNVSSGEMLITDNDSIVAQFATVKGATGWWATAPKFINNRYHEHLYKYYFKGKDKSFLINYLLDKENESLSTVSR